MSRPAPDPPQTMAALARSRYGPPEAVVTVRRPVPALRAGAVLVRVEASAVNTADWRIRAGAFPGVLAVPGRLMFGILGPRNPYLGSEFAGTVARIGPGVTRFRPGDRVFGIVGSGGATAEYLAVPQDAAIAPIPESLAAHEAAALPFGGLCALTFLSDYAGLRPGQRLLVVGASGGVGCYAVQIGKALGAHVTGVASATSAAALRALGADAAIDYAATRPADWPTGFDAILDTVGSLTPRAARRLLGPKGRFLPLNFGLREIGAAALNPLRDRKITIAVNEDTADGLARLAAMVEDGRLRPVVGHRFPLNRAHEAHALVQSRHRRGAVVIDLP